jgi:hypothetical protein
MSYIGNPAAASIAEVDAIVYLHWKKLRDDPKADPDACRRKIDYWLDRRLEMMDAIQDRKRRKEMLTV